MAVARVAPAARAGARAPARRGAASARATPVVARAAREEATGAWAEGPRGLAQRAASGLAALSLAATLGLGAMVEPPAVASELDVLNESVPSGYIIDDADILSRSSVASLNKALNKLESKTGYKLFVITLRKLQFNTDPFAFADKVIEGWFPTAELGDKKGVFVLVKTTKDGALVGGPSFSKSVGDELLESIITENIPTLAEEEKYNQAIISSVQRISQRLSGEKDQGPPLKLAASKGSNFKTKEQTDNKRGSYTVVVGGLLVISFVVPMIQYFAYVSGEEEEG